MYRRTSSLLRCLRCQAGLDLRSAESGDWIEEGELCCVACDGRYPIRRGVARFVDADNYAGNFGLQWNRFRTTQLDGHSGVPVSRDRFLRYTGWNADFLKGRLVLDAGCGAGRFAEIALSLGARVIAVDYSSAIDAARDNLKDRGDIDFIQADINALPFPPGAFPAVYCLGVIQHTPSPSGSFQALDRMVAPGGALAIDVYPATWKNLFFAKYWIRPLTKRISARTSLRIVERLFPALYGLSRLICRIPVAGHYLRYLIPVANYSGVYPLSPSQLREWALLDTFDMWAPAYDQPQSRETLRHWFRSAGYERVEVFHAGFNVGRGTKPAEAG